MNINFPNSSLYLGNRPYGDVVLINGIFRSSAYVCLVDTGADYLQLPTRAATAIGLGHLLINSSNRSVTTSGGIVTMDFVTGVNVEVEGYLVTVDILFSPVFDFRSTSFACGCRSWIYNYRMVVDIITHLPIFFYFFQ
jgi:hypothetical protein